MYSKIKRLDQKKFASYVFASVIIILAVYAFYLYMEGIPKKIYELPAVKSNSVVDEICVNSSADVDVQPYCQNSSIANCSENSINNTNNYCD